MLWLLLFIKKKKSKTPANSIFTILQHQISHCSLKLGEEKNI